MQNYFIQHNVFYCAKIESAKVICRFNGLKTAHSNRQASHNGIENLSAAQTFDYIKPGLTSCEDLAMALCMCVHPQGYK